MTRLIIARHGNTFDKGDTVLRVGARTNLQLSSSGCAQASSLGASLKEAYGAIDVCFVSRLRRTQETASIALSAMGISLEIQVDSRFDEMDYGSDDGKPEHEVIARLGEEAIRKWDRDLIIPDGWHLDVDETVSNWRDFAAYCLEAHKDKNILVVTSNGIARFAGCLAMPLNEFKNQYGLKLKTGAFGVFEYHGDWQIKLWDQR